MRNRATGILLAGGQSRRMGTDKAFVVLQGQTLIDRVICALRQACDEILIVANDTAAYARLDARVVPDSIRDFGPLAGLHAGLQAMRTDLGVAVAVDMPWLNPALLRAMIDAAEGWDVVIPALGGEAARAEATHHRAKELDMHPLHAVYRRTCLPMIQAAMDLGDRRLNAFLPAVRVRYFSAEDLRMYDPTLRSLTNVNSPEDLQRLAGGSR